jgi:putative methanogen marker protein 4
MTTIGIGVGEDAGAVLASLTAGKVSSQIICYCRSGTFDTAEFPFTIRESEHPHEDLVRDLLGGTIDAAVRGSLPANQTLRTLKHAMGVPRLERIALLETPSKKKFLLAPVGVDEGWSIAEKVSLIRHGRHLAKVFDLPDTVAIISGGRYGDIGRHDAVDRSLADAELTARIADAEHYEIQIEEAIEHSGMILAPDGITGNLIFRTLVFLGGGTGHGAPVVNIGKIFIDTSRASPDFSHAILLAERLAQP